MAKMMKRFEMRIFCLLTFLLSFWMLVPAQEVDSEFVAVDTTVLPMATGYS